MNKVIQDGTELFDVTVTITNGKAVVTKNTGRKVSTMDDPVPPPPPPPGGGGTGEER